MEVRQAVWDWLVAAQAVRPQNTSSQVRCAGSGGAAVVPVLTLVRLTQQLVSLSPDNVDALTQGVAFAAVIDQMRLDSGEGGQPLQLVPVSALACLLCGARGTDGLPLAIVQGPSQSAVLYNWNALLPELKQLGVHIDDATKGLIVSGGNASCLTRVRLVRPRLTAALPHPLRPHRRRRHR
jgi:hypothetical protein